ncbi:CGLD27 family protein [Sodalinema gerasimenkoae]|uniref:CGLD27 family protein n=1 Tax=Sodalinema gerasimenkoae TaxID=2862348 RepID=UPI00135A278C|nr:CGLD27 family protein [Sodalinema gerasimenkoae]
MNDLDLSRCPVPKDQQPIQEYQALKEGCLFGASQGTLGSYLKALAWIGGPSWLLIAPIAAASFAPERFPIQFLLSATLGASAMVGLALLRLFLGWMYIRDRLGNPVVVYEESGWYDGQTWTKTEAVLARDRLIVEYQLRPIFQRLRRTAVGLGLVVGVSAIAWSLA